ncbi:TetR/AcrR family transcriptional regulator [Roseococcus sp. YIM B11640]|uniref:TetR/AcrR family transcriptional regulator n=1 Tax=Roseococcus sp. YIM B11640 TaxID=3133973 RepID=UPI003C7A4A0E
MPREAGPQRQARGRQRMEQILDAADLVIQRQGTAFSLQQVAEAAKLPPASLYHYFPTNPSLLMELAKRYLTGFEALARSPIRHNRLTQWSDLCAIHAEMSLRFYHQHPVAMRLFLGPESGWEIRAADLATNERIGHIFYRKLIQHFVIAESEALERALAISVTIGDSIWALSFARHGQIEPEMAQEALRAKLAYLRLYIGEYAEKRAKPLPG